MAPYREYFLIVAGGFIGAALGAAFGAVVGWVFPEFVVLVAGKNAAGPMIPVGAGFGMVTGLPIGATVMVAARLIGAVRYWVGIRDGEARPE